MRYCWNVVNVLVTYQIFPCTTVKVDNVFISESPTCDVGTRSRIWAICFPPSCCPIKLIGDLVIFPVAQVFVIEVTVAIFVKETEKGTT